MEDSLLALSESKAASQSTTSSSGSQHSSFTLNLTRRDLKRWKMLEEHFIKTSRKNREIIPEKAQRNLKRKQQHLELWMFTFELTICLLKADKHFYVQLNSIENEN